MSGKKRVERPAVPAMHTLAAKKSCALDGMT
jgi:hypothetical protein